MENDATTFRFSLAEIPQSQRREIVREVAGRAIANLDLTPKTDDPQMEVETRFLPGLTVTDAWVSPHLASSYDLSRGDDDFTLLWSSSPAKGGVLQFGSELPADGSAALLSCADRMDFETHEAFPHVSVKLQRSLLSPLLPDAEAALMRRIPPDNPAMRLLKSYLGSYRALHDAGPTAQFAHRAAIHMADLVALAVGTDRDATELAAGRGLRAARLDAIKRWTLTHLISPELGIRSVANAAGLSVRVVQLLFEADGVTFTAFVLRERLALAHRRLSMPHLAKRTIAEIAYGCGFGDLSYFTNSFRRAYGETPSDVRHRALARPH
jgi:AraC-like DNA-binding protein